MIYKSYCAIDIEYFPFDIQNCYLKFGSWTYDGSLINLEHVNKNESIQAKFYEEQVVPNGPSVKVYEVEKGIDISEYYESVEWDLLSVTAQKNVKYYACCEEPYLDIYFNITTRRKTLFYTINLLIPCFNISFLSMLVFYLPCQSGEKVTLGISLLVALLVFYLLLVELIPPTSLVVPLLGKYLLFTLILVNLSILVTICISNVYHRNQDNNRMSRLTRKIFVDIMPRILRINRPTIVSKEATEPELGDVENEVKDALGPMMISMYPPSIQQALHGMEFIQNRLKRLDKETKVNHFFATLNFLLNFC